MDTLEQNYRAVVIGSSGGIGSAVLDRLRADPRCGEAIGLSRSNGGLDVTSEASVSRAAASVGGSLDLIFVATGALELDGHGPEKAFRRLEPDAMSALFALNAIGPAMVFKHFGALLPRNRRTIMAALSARVGSIGDNRLGGWMSYRASKAALNQLVRCAAIELARTHRRAVVASLHPGTVRTSLTERHRGNRDVLEPGDSAARLLDVLDGLSSDDSGGFFDYAGRSVEW